MKRNKIIVCCLIFLLLATRCFSQKSSNDSIIIRGKIVDELGVPIANGLVLFSPFYEEKFDINWKENDTSFSDKEGDFIVQCTRDQLLNNLYFKKKDYMPSRYFLNMNSKNITIDSSIVLYNRQRNWYDSKKINKSDLGMTMQAAIIKFKINITQSYLVVLRTSNTSAKAMEVELSDSSMILLIVEDYQDGTNNKKSILNKKIVGIGVAFTDGEKAFFGNALSYKNHVYNEYYLEKKGLTYKKY